MLIFVFLSTKVYAATLGTASDTVTTSRPSASTPLSADAAAEVGSISIYSNGSTFLTSDSARLWGQTQETETVATVSAAKTTLFFTGNIANAHANGTVVSSAITAVHTVKFTTQSTIPVNGTIVIQFPSSISADTNQASPSASAFMFNGLSTSNIKANFSSGTSTCSFAITGTAAGSTPTITCTGNRFCCRRQFWSAAQAQEHPAPLQIKSPLLLIPQKLQPQALPIFGQ